eukprot:m.21520 g.21520  ORF g.21520 m.21520 type:complete len:394 (+) comp3931_c1_seq1:1227-2408(+)
MTRHLPRMAASASKRAGRREDRSLLVPVKFRNVLPSIPFPSKHLPYPHDPQRFVRYKPSSLERHHKRVIHAGPDVGVPVDLIHKNAYKSDPTATLHPTDATLLDDDLDNDERRRLADVDAHWLRKTEYISGESRNIGKAAGFEHKVLSVDDNALRNATQYKDLDTQISLIEKTFVRANKRPKHPRNKELVPVEILPVFPDFSLWGYSFAQAQFDADPTPQSSVDTDEAQDMMSQALARGERNDAGEEFMGYYLPDASTMERCKRRRLDEDDVQVGEEFEFSKVREYTATFSTTRDSFFFVIRPDEGCFYNPLDVRVRLNKRRMKARRAQHRLLVKHREFSEEELTAQDSRFAQLRGEYAEEAAAADGTTPAAALSPTTAMAAMTGDDEEEDES